MSKQECNFALSNRRFRFDAAFAEILEKLQKSLKSR